MGVRPGSAGQSLRRHAHPGRRCRARGREDAGRHRPGEGEVLLADALRAQGRAVDLLLAHHPEGRALARLEEVMGLQADVWQQFGVSLAYGDAVMGERMAEIMRAFHPRNNEQAVSAARLLGLPVHVLSHAGRQQREQLPPGPVRRAGRRRHGRRTDRHAEGHPGVSAGGARRAWARYLRGRGAAPDRQDHGRHDRAARPARSIPSPSWRRRGWAPSSACTWAKSTARKPRKSSINVVIAGHVSSDSLGMNLIIDAFERNGVDVVACSGFTRVSRA